MLRTAWRAIALSTFLVLALTATAAAGLPSTTTTTTTPTAPVAPVQGALRLTLPDVFVVHGQRVTVPKRGLHVTGIVRPYVSGQWVTLKAYLGRRLIRRARLRVKPSRNGTYGQFSTRVISPRPGTVTVSVTHVKTTAQVGFQAQRRYTVLAENIGWGSTGRFVQLIQQRLAALHLYIPQSGVYDSGTGWAIDAYHRLLGWGTSQNLGGPTISYLLDGFGRFHIRFPRQGHHAEGNLGKQLLALADGSHVRWILPISSGKPSTPTILGDFRIYYRVPGYLPDGMYYSSFFSGGYAIHGYNPAPDYPASHGCMRLPIQDAISVYYWLHMNDWVDTYY